MFDLLRLSSPSFPLPDVLSLAVLSLAVLPSAVLSPAFPVPGCSVYSFPVSNCPSQAPLSLCPIHSVLSECPVLSVLSWLSCLKVLSYLFYPGCPIPAVLSLTSCPGGPIPAAPLLLLLLAATGCTVMAVLQEWGREGSSTLFSLMCFFLQILYVCQNVCSCRFILSLCVLSAVIWKFCCRNARYALSPIYMLLQFHFVTDAFGAHLYCPDMFCCYTVFMHVIKCHHQCEGQGGRGQFTSNLRLRWTG
jgi:hypothetical protein